MASSIGTTPVSGVGTSFIPDLTDTANIQSALKLLYYGTTQAATTNGIYGSLVSLQSQITATQAGVNVHETVKAATLVGTPIPGVYAAGTTDSSGGTGIGAKITYSATGVVTIDGVTLALNDRILVKDGTTALSGINSIANGIYYVSTLGAVGVACVLTRAEDSNNSIAGEMGEGDFVFVTGGTTPNNNTSWVLTSSSATGTGPAGAIKIGTDPVTYIQFGSVNFGSQTANTIYAGPTIGAAATPTFRNLSVNDIYPAGPPSGYGQVITYAPVGGGMAWSSASPMYNTGGTFSGAVYNAQPTPTSITTAGANTLTIAQILTGIITVTQTASVTLTLPTGALTEAGFGSVGTNASFDWIVINTGSSAGAVTMAAGGHTYVGSTSVPIATSARFRTVRNATNAYTTYRIA